MPADWAGAPGDVLLQLYRLDMDTFVSVAKVCTSWRRARCLRCGPLHMRFGHPRSSGWPGKDTQSVRDTVSTYAPFDMESLSFDFHYWHEMVWGLVPQLCSLASPFSSLNSFELNCDMIYDWSPFLLLPAGLLHLKLSWLTRTAGRGSDDQPMSFFDRFQGLQSLHIVFRIESNLKWALVPLGGDLHLPDLQHLSLATSAEETHGEMEACMSSLTLDHIPASCRVEIGQRISFLILSPARFPMLHRTPA